MSDDEFDPSQVRSAKSTMKSLFASDSKAAQRGSVSLQYDPNASVARHRKDEAVATAASASAANLPTSSGAAPAATGTVSAAQAPVQAYRDNTFVGAALAAVVVVNGNIPMIVVVDRDRRPLCRVRVTVDLQLLPNPQDPTYASLFDPSIGLYWSLLFKGAAECTQFVVSAWTLLHYQMLAEGPVEPYLDLGAKGSGKPVRKGDRVRLAMTIWILQRVAGGGTFYTAGKVVEEIPAEAPRSVTIGTGEVMIGAEELVVGMTAGSKRLGHVGPRKTKSSGLGNPEIGANDSVVVLIHCIGVDGAGSTDPLNLDDSEEEGDGNLSSDGSDELSRKKKKPKKKGQAKTASLGTALVPLGAPQAQPQQAVHAPAAPAAAAAAPAATAPGAIDQNTLIQTMLLQTLQMQQMSKQQQQQQTAPNVSSNPAVSIDLERSIDRLHQQLYSVMDKLDRLDVDGKLAKNNQAIERMVKKAVGKMPVNDVDVEDMAKDKEQLLARVEQLKSKLEEMTANYHKALETMSQHKDITAGLKNDLAIERDTANAKVKELQERKRLELVDLEVKHRRELDRVRDATRQEALDEGYQKGFAAGRIDALHMTGSSSTDQLKAALHKKEQELVESESKYQQLLSQQYKERRESNDQIQNLNHLIKRLEARDGAKHTALQDNSSAMCKILRRAMNSTYASIETQFYHTEKEHISVEDALAMVLISVKSETKTFVEEIKRDAQLQMAAASLGASQAQQAQEDEVEDEKPMLSTSTSEVEKVTPAAVDAYAEMRAELEAYRREQAAQAVQREVDPSSTTTTLSYQRYSDEQPAALPASTTGGGPAATSFDIDFSSLPVESHSDDPPLPPPPAIVHENDAAEERPPLPLPSTTSLAAGADEDIRLDSDDEESRENLPPPPPMAF